MATSEGPVEPGFVFCGGGGGLRTGWAERLREGGAALGVALGEDEARALAVYLEELLQWNRRFNLTGLRDPGEMVERLFVDSLACWLGGWIGAGARVVDVGSGAGFPGLVVAVTGRRRGVAEVTLVEASAKKVGFLKDVIARLGLSGVRALAARAEALGREEGFRESFDVGLVRAVGSLAVVAEYVLPLVRVGGWLLAMKGPGAGEEVRGADAAVRALGGRVAEIRWYRLPWCGQRRAIVAVGKVGATDVRFPRRVGVARRRPLR